MKAAAPHPAGKGQVDPIDTLYGCLKDLPRSPLAELEAEHRVELETKEHWRRHGR
jgi:hypothetical protein